jgi:flavin reductase (DIM6/NTAB) family NADH-FMN oxidoreductase RutF
VVLCGTYDSEGKANLATLAWAGVCCSEPPAIQLSIRHARHTYAAILDKKEFTISLPTAAQADIADFCGITSGRDVDKLNVAGLTAERGQFVNAPVVGEFPVCLECRLLHRLEIGSHDLFVGEVLASWADEKYLDGKGVIDLNLLSPLAYTPSSVGSGYYALGPSAGKPYSIGKSFIK